MITVGFTDVTVGETKRIILDVLDEAGQAATLQSLTVTLYRPDGSVAQQLSLANLTQSGNSLEGTLTFDTPGRHTLEIKAADASGNTEIERTTITVLP